MTVLHQFDNELLKSIDIFAIMLNNYNVSKYS